MSFGWVIHYDDGDMDYTDFEEGPYDTYEEAYERAEEMCSSRGVGANTMHAYDSDKETSEDIGDGEIDVFKI